MILAVLNMKYVKTLKPNEIILAGTNIQGKHGKGLALYARQHFGLKLGHSRGLCGQAYGIVTKDLTKGLCSIPLGEINSQIRELNSYTHNHPHLTFYLTPIGSGLAGYKLEDIEALFDKYNWGSNCIFTWR